MTSGDLIGDTYDSRLNIFDVDGSNLLSPHVPLAHASSASSKTFVMNAHVHSGLSFLDLA